RTAARQVADMAPGTRVAAGHDGVLAASHGHQGGQAAVGAAQHADAGVAAGLQRAGGGPVLAVRRAEERPVVGGLPLLLRAGDARRLAYGEEPGLGGREADDVTG